MNAADLARRRRVQLVAAYQRWRRTLDAGLPAPRPTTAPAPIVPVSRAAVPARRPPR